MAVGLGRFKIKRIGMAPRPTTPKFLGKVGIRGRGRPKGSKTTKRSFGVIGL